MTTSTPPPTPRPLLDRAAIERLLPHRSPLLLVDAVDSLVGDPARLHARFAVRADAPVLAGHFPGRPVWPGVYTIEGLAQAAGLLLGLGAWAAGTATPSLPAGAVEAVLLGAADVRLLAPVLPGCELHYLVTLQRQLGDASTFLVAAEVAGAAVARGRVTLIAATGAQPR